MKQNVESKNIKRKCITKYIYGDWTLTCKGVMTGMHNTSKELADKKHGTHDRA